jgi:hypothetical protein
LSPTPDVLAAGRERRKMTHCGDEDKRKPRS